MNRNILFWIFAFYWSCTVYANAVYTDCERPPPLLHGRSELSVDDDGIIVSAQYSCDAGYRLYGQAQMICDTDTDEWQGDLPACQLETGNNSSVSEIETPEIIEATGTVAPELTHQEIVNSVEELTKNEPNEINSNAVSSQAPPQLEPQQTETPEQVPPEHESQETETPEIEDQQQTHLHKKRRRKGKGKVAEYQEDNSIDVDFASRLDMTCIEGTVAPTVNDAYIVEYIRARKEEFKFLVAVYACDEDFYLENPQANRLYCSQGSWVGNYPVCVFKEGDMDYGTDSDVDDQNENNETNKNSIENVTRNSVQEINENKAPNEDKIAEETVTVAPIQTINEQINTNEVLAPVQPSTEAPIDTIHNEIPTDVENCNVNNGGCEHICLMIADEEIGIEVPECSCREGFSLDPLNGRKCMDINECDYPNVCPSECENTIGSYHCLEEPEIEIIPTNVNVSQENEINAPVKACGDGLRLDASNNCIDIDECAEGNTGCQYCQNNIGGFQCTCPDGFELNNDEKTCRDIDECTLLSDYEYEDNNPTARSICSHECINTIGSYICRCPYNFHLRDDKRTCEQDFCRHLNDIAANKTKCSHDCVDDVDGYHCKCPEGMKLDTDMKSCIYLDACSTSGDRCLPGKCVNTDDGTFKCECPTGFAEHNQRCVDYDECAIGTHQCSHECLNIEGSYLCECPDSLALSSDKHTCISIETTDFCATDNGGCSDICNVVNEIVICSCLDGSVLDPDGKTCRPKNICSENNGGCQQVCNAELNRCECFPGFQTFDDGKTCTDLNECLQNNGGCSQQCVNSDGGYDCTCFEGFYQDPETDECIDKNECELNNGNCDHDCSNTKGSYICSCRAGYSLSVDQHHCFDTNECEINNGNCSHTCNNLQGSYQCTCPEGQFLVNDDHTCEYLNECEVNNGGCSHKCNYKKGILTCSCPHGFELDEAGKVCIDQNECLINNGGCAHHCENLNGTHLCKCNVGYQLASDKYGCLDVDECIENNGNCSNICINLLGSYSCACEAGFKLKPDKHTCYDIDECTDSIHDCDQICINVPGAYECECRAGYKLARDHLSCIDIDECALPNACVDNSKCINTIGSFYCNCPIGYELSETNECIDKNECDVNAPKSCSHECINTPGSFKCACPNGMELASDQTTCNDVNECAIDPGICSHACENVEGSYRCHCPVGYKLSDDQKTCKDIDECAVNNGGCEQKCVNIEGSSYCECNIDGFILANDKKSCINSDPCGIKNGGCAHVCEPLNGKTQCFCYKGFELNASDNRSCTDINECLLNHGCESKCINTIGSYKCDCQKGFRLNAAGNCEDVNECEVYENGGCSPNSECINFLGSFRCICPTGYKLDNDKVTCIEIKDRCSALVAPEHGNVRCTRARHMLQQSYRTKCSFWCSEGYTLIGPSVKYCNGTDGNWDTTEITCVQSACPPLLISQPGTMTDNCLNGETYPGQSCALICPPGFMSTAPGITKCLPNRQWSRTDLRCEQIQPAPVPDVTSTRVPSHNGIQIQSPKLNRFPTHHINSNKVRKPKVESRIHGGEIHSRGHVDHGASGANDISQKVVTPLQNTHIQSRPQVNLRPYIKCPRDTIIVLPKNKKSVFVKLEQPKSNVNWATHIDAHPKWAKNLQAHLAAGQHTITFTAHSPNSADITESCRTVIIVKSPSSMPSPPLSYHPPPVPAHAPVPQVRFCPQPYDIQLQPHERQRAVYWREPVFYGDLKQIFKSHLPGTKFGAGHHKVIYIATDIRSQNATCQFDILIRATVVPHVNAPFINSGAQFNHLDNHESYLLCPGKPDMKLDTNFPVSRVRVFYRKLPKNHRLRHDVQNQIHVTRSDNTLPKNFIDIYHWIAD